MKKLNYVSPKAMYILLEEEDIIRTSPVADENAADHLHGGSDVYGD